MAEIVLDFVAIVVRLILIRFSNRRVVSTLDLTSSKTGCNAKIAFKSPINQVFSNLQHIQSNLQTDFKY